MGKSLHANLPSRLGGTIPFSFTLGSDASSEGQIGRFIDYETQGDIEFLNPFRSVELVLNLSTACQPIDFLVLAPTRSQTWGDENVTFQKLSRPGLYDLLSELR